MTPQQFEKAAAFCGFDEVKEYRLWLAKLKKEKRVAALAEVKAASR